MSGAVLMNALGVTESDTNEERKRTVGFTSAELIGLLVDTSVQNRQAVDGKVLY
jgi:hypothetical protein